MTAATFIALAQTALRKFTHAPLAPCASDPAQIISNPKTGGLGLGCLKCERVIEITVGVQGSMIVKPGDSSEPQPKPRFRIP
jgi:hypothetical protein